MPDFPRASGSTEGFCCVQEPSFSTTFFVASFLALATVSVGLRDFSRRLYLSHTPGWCQAKSTGFFTTRTLHLSRRGRLATWTGLLVSETSLLEVFLAMPLSAMPDFPRASRSVPYHSLACGSCSCERDIIRLNYRPTRLTHN